jgi:hypothetical protein
MFGDVEIMQQAMEVEERKRVMKPKGEPATNKKTY